MRLGRVSVFAVSVVSILACAKSRELPEGRPSGAMHELPYVASHTAAALDDISSCTECHGTDYGGGDPSCNSCHEQMLGFADWKTNCSFCHGTRTAGLTGTPGASAAPPLTARPSIDQSSANPSVGAHQAHLVAGTYSRPLPCESCHGLPPQTFPESFGHIDGKAVVVFSTFAQQGVATPGYSGGTCAVYCHGSTALLGERTSPAWTSTGSLSCGSCHPSSPASGEHALHAGEAVPCASCHPGYSVGTSTVDLDTHVNGTLEATPINAGGTTFSSWPSSCTACH